MKTSLFVQSTAGKVALLAVFCLVALPGKVYSQMEAIDTVNLKPLSEDPNDRVYFNQAAGEFTPGKGFQVAKNKFASLNFSLYAMARYLNQIPGEATWNDHYLIRPGLM